MKKIWSVKWSSADGMSATVNDPHRLKLSAWLEAHLTRRWEFPVAKIVNHDDEMRAWKRYDWVDYPTADDIKQRQTPQPGVITIGSIAPGQSIAVTVDGVDVPGERGWLEQYPFEGDS